MNKQLRAEAEELKDRICNGTAQLSVWVADVEAFLDKLIEANKEPATLWQAANKLLPVKENAAMNRGELKTKLTGLAGWFRLYTGMLPDARENCAQVCEEAAKAIDMGGFNYKECEMYSTSVTTGNTPLETVDLWFVQGLPDKWYPTKIVAEQAARITFPEESPAKQYARIYYRPFTEVD